MSNPNILLNSNGNEYLITQLFTYDTLNEPIQPFTPSGGGGSSTDARWGKILGTLSDQTDLWNKLTNLQTQIDNLDPDTSQYAKKTDLEAYAKTADVYTKAQADTLLLAKADANLVYVKTEIDTLLNDKVSLSELNALSEQLQTETQAREQADTNLQTAINAKLDASAIANYYTKTETDGLLDGKLDTDALDDYYNKTEVDEIIAGLEPSGTVYKFKGNVADYDALLAIVDKTQGDVYNLLDTGANYAWTGTEWDKLSETIDLSGYAKSEDLEDLQETVDNSLAHQDGNIQAMVLRMEELAERIEDLKSLDPEVVVCYDGGETQYNNPIKDFQLSGLITSPAIITSNSVTLKEATLTATYADLYADQDITIKQGTFTGSVPKATSNSIYRLRANGYITLRDIDMSIEKAYNAVECGLTEAVAKSIIIDNVRFDGPLTNNAINVFGMADGGVVTISNCYFKKVSNLIRLSNRLDTTWTINLINCVCDGWEKNSDYAGMILLQDYTSKTQEEATASRQFKKLTINIQNCTKPDGTKITPVDNLATICGSRDNNQILYVYDAFNGVRPYNTDIYPTINIQ